MARMRRLTLASVAMVLGVLTVGVASVSAKTGYQNLCPSLQTALCASQVGVETGGLAVDNSSGPSAGDVWVSYIGSRGLVKFDESGNRLTEAEIGNLSGFLRQVAVDPTNGDVYLATSAPGTVAKFDSSGVFQSQITGTPGGSIEPLGLAVGGEGDLYVEDVAHEAIDRFSPSGEYLGQFPVPGLSNRYFAYLAAGPEGNLYVGLGQPYTNREDLVGEVREYTPTGAPVDCPGGDNILSLPPEGFLPVAVDPSNGQIFVGEGSLVSEYDSLCSAQGAMLGREEGPAGAIGVSKSTHEVYVSGVNNDHVGIYRLVTLPTVTTGTPAANVTRTSATVSGTVNPESSEVTTCEFEYGPTIFYGQTAPCSPFPEPPFTGGSPVTVSAELAFVLPPDSAIHYRLKAGGSSGVEYGADEAITRPAPPLVVDTRPAAGVTQFTATLNGAIEPGETPADYHFEYGTSTAYGSIAPVPDNTTPITNELLAVSQPVVGLRAGTTYHYRLIASGPGGTNIASSDMTFTTLPVPVPTVTTGASEGVGVSTATLTGTVDPHGWDTSYLFEYGTSTAYGQSWPTVQVDMGALEGPQPVVVSVPELLPGTTYHYRLIATNGGGTTYGPDMTFTTGNYPAQTIQEPVALRTLLVPTGGETAKPSGKKAKKKTKKGKAGHRARHARGGKKGKKK
jgi:hypothetical protein